MATITPTWTDNVSVIAADITRAGTPTRATVDARGKWGVRFHVRLGRTGTTALTNGVDVRIRPAINNDGIIHPGVTWRSLSLIAAASSTTVDSDSNSGQNDLNVASETGFAAGDDIIVSGGSGTREEFHRVAKTAAGVLTLDSSLKTTHTAVQADTVINKANAWSVELPGGTVWEVVVDYSDDAAGDTVRAVVLAQTFDSVASA